MANKKPSASKNGDQPCNTKAKPEPSTAGRGTTAVRLTVALLCATIALTAAVAWAAQWTFGLAVAQQIGLVSERYIRDDIRGVTLWVSDEMSDHLWLGLKQQHAVLEWSHYHEGKPGQSWTNRKVAVGSFRAGVGNTLFSRPSLHRRADGSTIRYAGYSRAFVVLPLWGLCLVFGITAAALLRGPARRHRRRRCGQCLTCGYDLRNLTQPRCPECGSTF